MITVLKSALSHEDAYCKYDLSAYKKKGTKTKGGKKVNNCIPFKKKKETNF